MDKMVQKPNYVEELLEILRSSLAADELQDQISDYHESDIADAFEQLTEEERRRLYPLLGPEWTGSTGVVLHGLGRCSGCPG